ncbi:MAG: PHP domain-containing protein [Firmicutes bacterium]|nr:PHP domain-containing protein [Bacillota bacterium]
MSLIIDFHVHGKLKSSFPFCEKAFYEKIKEAKGAGLNAFALSDHSHAVDFLEKSDYMYKNYELVDDCFIVDGFKIFSGVEITTKEELDIVVIANPSFIRELQPKVPKGISLANLIMLLPHGNDILIFLAHPFRNHSDFPTVDKKTFLNFDAVELNATDLATFGESENRQQVENLANELKLKIVGGSDTHFSIQCGSIRNVFEKDITKIRDLKGEIFAYSFTIEIDATLTTRVKSAAIIKELMVQEHERRQLIE